MRDRKKNHGMKRFISYILATAMVMTSIPGTLLASAEELSDEYLAAPVGGDEFLSDGSEEIANGTGVIADTTAGSGTVVTEPDMEAGSKGAEDLLSDGDGSAEAAYAPINFEKVLESGMTVKVKVPENVFPEGTDVKAADVTEEEMESLTAKIKEDLEGQLDGEIVKILAADISFLSKEEINLLPGTDVDVTLVPSDEVKAELKEKEEKGLALTLVYVPTDGKAVVVEKDKITEKSIEGIAFKTVQFPRYAIVATANSEEETPAEATEETKEDAAEETAAEQKSAGEPEIDADEESVEETGDAAEEAKQVVSAKAEGVRKSYYTYFTAELSGATVTAAVPYYFVSKGTTMEVSFTGTDAYESIISKANYGKEITDLKAVEISFADRRGREISLYSVNLSIELENTGAETYVLYQPYTGGFGTDLYQLRTSRRPKFTVYAISDSYVVAGLKADGIDRVSGVTRRGTTTFNLTTADGTAISVSGSEKAFSGTTYLEVQDANTSETEALAEAALAEKGETLNEVVKAFDLSFHTADGAEIEPKEEVVVSIEAPLAADATYQMVHIKDDGTTETLDEESVRFDEYGATFTSDEFSTYALVWTVGETEYSATIHWGYMDGTNFVELEPDSTVTMDTTAASISLENSYEGYLYTGSYYCKEGESFDQKRDIGSILYKADAGWECDVIETETSTTTRTPVANNSEIYVTYTTEGDPNPSGAADSTIPSPVTTKTVTPNGDGTYTIQLDIEGATVHEDESHYANVLIILDATKSMNGNKWNNAKAAMKVLIETLTEGDNAANDGKVDFALVTFGRSATVVQNWTKNNAAFKTTCAGINMVTTSGTNWEAGMRGGLYGVLNNMPDDDPTYTIFLTDGDPNVYYSSGSDTNYTNTGTTQGYSQNSDTSADHSADEAKEIAAKTKLYGIYCGDSGQNPSGASFNRLVKVITGTGQGGQKTIAANANTIQSEFKAIAETMLLDMGASNVSVDDGITGLSSVSANVVGEPGGYEYYKKVGNGNFEKWTEAPGATYSTDNGVTWDLSNTGTLMAGTTYRIKFTVWPSQEAYDLLADLNNNVTSLDKLEETTLEQLQIKIGETDYVYNTTTKQWTGGKTTEELLALIKGASNVRYSILTNTHLNTTYTFKDETYTDSPDKLVTGAMLLEDEVMRIEKVWQNDVDDKTAQNMKINVIKDGATYLQDVKLTYDASTKKSTADNLFISCGLITGSGSTYKVKEYGHEYSFKEPTDYGYYWDLSAEIYRPMVINGTKTMLVKTDAEGVNGLTEGTDYYIIKGNYYKKSSAGANTLAASNVRRSYIDLTKKVEGNASADLLYPFTVTFKFPEGSSNDHKLWFSVKESADESSAFITGLTGEGFSANSDNESYYSNSATVDTDGVTVTIYIKAGWNVRFLNTPVNAEYTIIENLASESPDKDELSNFTVKKVDVTAQTGKEGKPASVVGEGEDAVATVTFRKKGEGVNEYNEAGTLTGKIAESDRIYKATFTNQPRFFYIYHSSVASDGDLEKIPMKNVNPDGTYNLYAKTKEGTLYGGYYLNYKGKGSYADNGVAADGGIAYNGVNCSWFGDNSTQTDNPQTVSGKAMKPIAGETYYIKEVPTWYLQNYCHYQYVIDTKVLTSLYLVSAIDDANYKATGFYLTKENADNTISTVRVARSLTFKMKGRTEDYKLYPYWVFGVFEEKGMKEEPKAETQDTKLDDYITYWKANNNYFTTGSFKMIPYWVTPDGIEVKGVTTRTVTISELTTDGIGATES